MFFLQINKTIDNNHRVLDVLDANHRTLDAIDNFCKAVLGKGYDKLEQWRRGEIDRINYDEVDQMNWEIYLREEAERTYNNWFKKNPTYFEDKNINNICGCSLISMIEGLRDEMN